jgi:hypothetical protein
MLGTDRASFVANFVMASSKLVPGYCNPTTATEHPEKWDAEISRTQRLHRPVLVGSKVATDAQVAVIAHVALERHRADLSSRVAEGSDVDVVPRSRPTRQGMVPPTAGHAVTHCLTRVRICRPWPPLHIPLA